MNSQLDVILPGPIANSFEAIGKALHAGGDPMEVAVVCFAAATALRNPEDEDEIQRSAENIIAGMQARKSKPPCRPLRGSQKTEAS